MDKNTIYGLLLMALVFFGFMWLQPKNEEKKVDSEIESAEAAQTAPKGYDILSDQETDWLRRNIAANGDAAPAGQDGETSGIITHSDPLSSLSLKGDSIYGFVKVDGREIPYAQIINPADSGLDIDTQRKGAEIIRSVSNSMGRFGKFAKFLAGSNSKTTLENDALLLELDSKSGSITKALLKKYDTEYSADESKKVKNKVVIFENGSNTFNFALPLPQPVETKDLYFSPRMLNDSTLLMALDVEPYAYWGIEYTLPKGDNYLVKVRIVQKNMGRVVDSNNRILTLNWAQDVRRQEKGRMFEERNSGLFYKFAGGSVENLSESKNDSEDRQAKVKWIGFKNQFFSSVLISGKNFNNADLSSQIIKNSDYLKHLEATATVNDYDWNADSPADFSLYIGPNLYPLLRHLQKDITPDENLELTRLIPLGWALFRWINTWIIIPVFNFLGSFISSYGLIIFLLTILIKLVLFPLTYKSLRSQAVMRLLSPEIKAINDKYPGQDNAMLRNQKTMALYSKAGASPMSGCLPMLLQMPILFAMFTFFPSAIELRGQSFLWAHDLAAPDAIVSWSTYIPLITPYFGNHISLFCLLMTITNILYTYINMQNSPGQMPGMKWMMYMMPLFFLVFFNNYAAGLSYYYFLSLLISIMQTYAFRYFVSEEKVRAQMAANAKKPKKKSGFMARLEEAQRQQQEMLRQQQKKNSRR